MPYHHTPAATRTGIVIGGAYTPRRSPSYADPIEHHVTRRGHSAALYVGGVILALMGALLVAGVL